jgi:hypothetical protein
VALAVLLTAAVLPAGGGASAAAAGDTAADSAPTPGGAPFVRLQRPPGPGPAYVTACGGGGSLAAGDQARPGYSLAVVFRPHRAADFHHPLYAWNTGLVLQIDRQGGGPATLISGDAILRRYLADMRPRDAGRAAFVGLGAGISHASWQDQPDSPDGSADGFSFLLEVGVEWNLDRALVLTGKGQYRLYDRGGHDLSGWSLHGGVGLPLPF